MIDPAFQKNIDELMGTLPAVVRSFLLKELDGVARNLVQRYKLHVDQGAVLQRDLMLVLLGVRDPQKLAENLKEEALIDDQTLTALLTDVNNEIFTPLQNKMRAESKEPSGGVASSILKTPPALPTTPSAPQIPVPTMSTPLANKVLNRLEVLPENLPGVVLPKTAPKPSVPSQLSGALRSAGIQLLSDHEVAHIDLKKPSTPAAYPMQPLRPQTPVPPPAPRPIPPPIAPQAAPIKPAAPTPMPSLPNYTIDPYREMPDEHEK